jgi:hypothetical protein
MMPSFLVAATPQLTCSPAELRFGGVPVGQSEAQTVVFINNGQTGVTLSGIAVSGSEFKVTGLSLPVTLAAGQSVAATVAFAPTATEWMEETVAVSSSAPNSSLQLVVSGSGLISDSVIASPSSLSFGTVGVGSSAVASVVLTNERPWTRSITSLAVIGNAFSVSGLTLPVNLAPHESVTLKVTFSPRVAREFSGSVFLYGPGLNIPVVGWGNSNTVGQLSVSPSSLNSGSVDLGSSSAQTVTLTAAGGSVTVSSESSSNSQFSISGPTVPFTLTAGQSTQAQLIFTPTTAGSVSGAVTVNSNASDTNLTEAVAGTGVAAKYSVSLSWNGSTSAVSGYNVYRGTSAGSYSRLNSSIDPNTSYTDSTVASGTTYYYAATSVSTNGQESGYSSPVKVVIP